MHVVWIMHSQVRDETDICTGKTYAKYTHQGVRSSVDQIVQACDLVAQLQQIIRVEGKGKDAKHGIVRGDGDRELVTGSIPFSDVKSRFHQGEARIPVELGVNPLADIM